MRHLSDSSFVDITYWTSHQTIETQLSQLAVTFIQPHEHNWLFGHGGGNSVLCALGPAGTMRRFTSDPDIVDFLSLTHRFVGTEAAQHYLKYALNPKISGQFSRWLNRNKIVTSEIDTEEKYNQWLEKASAYIADFSELSVYRAS